MNVCILSGRLVRNAVGNQEKALAFTLATRYGFDPTDGKERVAFVPCVMFNPPKELVELLTNKGKGLLVELEGRVSNSSYEADGERKYKTDVIVKNGTFSLMKG